MNPTSLLNVSPDLMRAHAGRDFVAAGPMAGANDRWFACGVVMALAALATVLAVALT